MKVVLADCNHTALQTKFIKGSLILLNLIHHYVINATADKRNVAFSKSFYCFTHGFIGVTCFYDNNI